MRFPIDPLGRLALASLCLLPALVLPAPALAPQEGEESEAEDK